MPRYLSFCAEQNFLNRKALFNFFDVALLFCQGDSTTMSEPVLFTLGPVPASWDASKSHVVHTGISETKNRSIEPVGPHFLAHARRKRHGRTFSEDERIQAEQTKKDVDENVDDEEEEKEDYALLHRDPKDWKEQDHYAVLGLSKYRYLANDEQIKRAHRKKVLKHHPDKKASSGNVNDDAFFKCIQKAHEVLSDPVRRRQFDSVDEGIPDDVPDEDEKGDFFTLYAPVFKRESRFSNTKPVPQLGDADSTKADVEGFYDFWYNFDSWRSFEYLDKEEGGGTDSRDDKRYQERKNKAERARRKKEDIARLRKIVDQTLGLDPRIKKFKQEEKAQKNAKKNEREREAKLAEENRIRAAAEAKVAAEKAEAEAKLAREDAKKQKEIAKRAVKKNKKVVKTSVKDNNYFNAAGQDAPASLVEQVLAELDVVLGNLEPEDLDRTATEINNAETVSAVRAAIGQAAAGIVSAKKAKDTELAFFLQDVPVDNTPAVKSSAQTTPASSALPTPTPTRPTSPGGVKAESRPWTPEENNALVKAANKFPGGTVNRWDTISAWVAQHTGLPPRTSDELIAQTQAVKSGSTKGDMKNLQTTGNKKTASQANKDDTPTTRDPYENGNGKNTLAPGWNAKQQAQLESAMQKYPPGWMGKGMDRWEAIARTVDGHSKKSCKERVKALSEEIKAKKAAAGQ